MIRRITGRIREFFTSANNAMSSQVRVVMRRFRSTFSRPSHDWGRSDYAFWQRAYYCRARGLELSGLFIKPLVSKVAAWTLGRPPDFRLENEASQEALDNWWNEHHPQILKAFRGALTQGDSFLVVNSDLSITLLPPDTVDPIVDEADFAAILGWRVTQVIAHPTETARRMTVVDEYYPDRRVHRVEIDGTRAEETVYANLLDRLPIVHIPNQPDSGETFGHAEAEALVEVLQRYGVVMEAAIEGNELMGRPTPVLTFESQSDLNAWWNAKSARYSRTLPDGTSETGETVPWDPQQLVSTTGGFSWQAPGSFAEDTERLLGLMFYLILEHTEIPEFVFGNAISSSKASAETQMPVFETFIEMRRGDITGWLTAIAEIALGYLSLIEPGVVVETPAIQWKKLTQDGRLTLDTLTWALTAGLIDERTALMLAPVDVEDIDNVLETAREEKEARRETMAAIMQPAAQPTPTPVPQPAQEMYSNGHYSDAEAEAVVQAAARMLAGGSYERH